jgi:hypothetical protein
MSDSKSRYFKNIHNKINEHRNKIFTNFYVSKRIEIVSSINNESIHEKIKPTEDMDTYDKCSIYCKKYDTLQQEYIKRCNILNTVNHLKVR